jgi:ABC-type uncharacterized transport system YnjBCD permease subunit
MTPALGDPVVDEYVDYRLRTLLVHALVLKLNFALFVIVAFALFSLNVSVVLSIGALLIVSSFQSTWIINHDCELEREGTVGQFPLIYLSCIVRDPERSPDECWRLANNHLLDSRRRSRDESSHAGKKIFRVAGQIAQAILFNLVLTIFLGWLGTQLGKSVAPLLARVT